MKKSNEKQQINQSAKWTAVKDLPADTSEERSEWCTARRVSFLRTTDTSAWNTDLGLYAQNGSEAFSGFKKKERKKKKSIKK